MRGGYRPWRMLSLVAGGAMIGVLLLPVVSAAASKQVRFECPVETTKSVRLSTSDSDLDVVVGDECTCSDLRVNLETGLELYTEDLVRKVVTAPRPECPSCGEDVGPTDKFCGACGEKLDPSSPYAEGRLKCGHCEDYYEPKGGDILETECPSCGHELAQTLQDSWKSMLGDDSRVRFGARELPAEGEHSNVKLYCYDKTDVLAYWEKLLVAELGL